MKLAKYLGINGKGNTTYNKMRNAMTVILVERGGVGVSRWDLYHKRPYKKLGKVQIISGILPLKKLEGKKSKLKGKRRRK